MKFLWLFRTTLSTRHFFLLQISPQKWRIYAQCSLSKFKKRYACTAHVRLGIQNRYSDWPWDRNTKALNAFTNTEHPTWPSWFLAGSAFCANVVPTAVYLTVGYVTPTSRWLLFYYNSTSHLFCKTFVISYHGLSVFLPNIYPNIRWGFETVDFQSRINTKSAHGETLQEFSNSINTTMNYSMYHCRNSLL